MDNFDRGDLAHADSMLAWGRRKLKKQLKPPEPIPKSKKTRVLVEWEVPDRAGNPQITHHWVVIDETVAFNHDMTFDYAGQGCSIQMTHKFKVLKIEE